MLSLTWIRKDVHGNELELERVDLSSVAADGVYVIWHGGQTPWTVRVGQGDVADRLGCHRRDSAVLAYKQLGTLYVTWAVVPAAYRDGVEKYLADRLAPRVGDAFPDVAPIPANLPWAA